ncbi:MAG: hypothetical protein HZC15_03415 [Candidatus Omnitrophica bacterium]|nr:hypothetical protein [Candidatus Omnitrophota bacterium]
MMPFLLPRSFAIVRFCGVDQLCLGDIAVFKEKGLFICHRVIKILQRNSQVILRTKPDISFLADPLINNSLIVGKIISVQYGKVYFKIDSFPIRIFGYLLGYSIPFLARVYFKTKKILYAFNNRN